MAGLEKKLGTELFRRSRRGSALTPAGERFVPYARRCLAMLDDAHRAVRTPDHERLVVAASAPSVFPPVLATLSAAGVSAHGRVSHSAEAIGQCWTSGSCSAGWPGPASSCTSCCAPTSSRSAGPNTHSPGGGRMIGVADLLDGPALDLVRDAGYVAIVPGFAAAAALRAGSVRELPHALRGWALEVQLAYRADVGETPGVRVLLAAEPEIVGALGGVPT